MQRALIIRLFTVTPLLLLSLLAMAQPAKPPNLNPYHTYLHVISPSSPDVIAQTVPASSAAQIRYVGPVGELTGEHIFEVVRDGRALKRDQEGWAGVKNGVVKEVKGVQGVKAVKVLEVKQRTKRGDEL